MADTRLLTVRGWPSRAFALLMAAAVLAAGVGFPPASLAGTAIASVDDRQSDSQPCEEPSDEPTEDEESSAGKHPAVLGGTASLDPPVANGPGVTLLSARLPAGLLASSASIRGPPAAV